MEGCIKEEHEFVNKNNCTAITKRGVHEEGHPEKGEWPLLVPKGQAVSNCVGYGGRQVSSTSSSVRTQQALKTEASQVRNLLRVTHINIRWVLSLLFPTSMGALFFPICRGQLNAMVNFLFPVSGGFNDCP